MRGVCVCVCMCARAQEMDHYFNEAQRQGRMSFYMQASGEEAIHFGCASALKNGGCTPPTPRVQACSSGLCVCVCVPCVGVCLCVPCVCVCVFMCALCVCIPVVCVYPCVCVYVCPVCMYTCCVCVCFMLIHGMHVCLCEWQMTKCLPSTGRRAC